MSKFIQVTDSISQWISKINEFIAERNGGFLIEQDTFTDRTLKVGPGKIKKNDDVVDVEGKTFDLNDSAVWYIGVSISSEEIQAYKEADYEESGDFVLVYRVTTDGSKVVDVVDLRDVLGIDEASTLREDIASGDTGKGAELVGFGSRTVHDKLTEIPSAADHGVSPSAGIAAWQEAYDAGVAAGNDVIVASDDYAVNGRIALSPSRAKFDLKAGGTLGGFNNIPVGERDKPTWGVSGWTPTITRSLVHSDEYYNHQPAITVDLDGRYLCAWMGNPGSTDEGDAGQRLYASWSSDEGATWSARVEIVNNGTYITNPHVVTDTQWQPRLRRVRIGDHDEVWMAYTLGRLSTNEGFFLAKRTASSDKLTQYRVVRKESTGEFELLANALAAADIPAGYSIYVEADGDEWYPYPLDMMQLRNGTVVIGCVLTTPSGDWGSSPKRFGCLLFSANGDKATFSTLAPRGVVGDAETWEMAMVEIGDIVKAYIRVNNDNAIPGYRQAISFSADGCRTWSACEWLDQYIHREQPSATKINETHAVLSVPDQWGARNNRGLYLVSEHSIIPGLSLSNETDGNELAHGAYVDTDFETGALLMAYAQGTASPVEIHDIRFAKFTAPCASGELNLIPRKFAAYALNDNNTATWDALSKTLTITGAESAGLELPGGTNLAAIRFSTSAEPTTRVTIAVLGTPQDHILWRLDSSSTGGVAIQVCRVRKRGNADSSIVVLTTRRVDSAQAMQSIVFAYDAKTGQVHTEGLSLLVPLPLTFMLGDGYLDSLQPTTFATVYYLDGVVVSRVSPDALGYVAQNRSGPNLLLNPAFRWDQQRDGASSYTSVGPIMDGWVLSDEGGSSYTVTRATFSAGASATRFNSWQKHMRIQTSGLGSTPGKIRQWWDGYDFAAGIIAMLGVTAWDEGGKSYKVEVYWTVDYGSGGSTELSTRIGTLHVDGSVGRRQFVPCAVPPISGTATVGAGARAALEFRIPSDDIDGLDLRMTCVDFYQGVVPRDFVIPTEQEEREAILRQYEVIEAAVSDAKEFVSAYASSTTEVRGVVHYPEKRRVPTVSYSGDFEFHPGNLAMSSLSAARVGRKSFCMIGAVTGATAGGAGVIRAKSDATARIVIDARHSA